jgi:D-alanyl-D-alanine dipeptidase
MLQDTRILMRPEYFRQGLPGAINEIYAREGVIQNLLLAASRLPTGYYLLVWDAWRPLSVQQALFDRHCQALRRRYRSLTEDELRRKAENYVSLPSKHLLHPSPHYTGGALDLTLADALGRPLPMGTEFDAFSSLSSTRALEVCIENGELLNEEEQAGLHNRRVLYHAMTTSGFTNYREEWWHYDYGDQFWAAASGSDRAFYGGIEP